MVATVPAHASPAMIRLAAHCKTAACTSLSEPSGFKPNRGKFFVLPSRASANAARETRRAVSSLDLSAMAAMTRAMARPPEVIRSMVLVIPMTGALVHLDEIDQVL